MPRNTEGPCRRHANKQRQPRAAGTVPRRFSSAPVPMKQTSKAAAAPRRLQRALHEQHNAEACHPHHRQHRFGPVRGQQVRHGLLPALPRRTRRVERCRPSLPLSRWPPPGWRAALEQRRRRGRLWPQRRASGRELGVAAIAAVGRDKTSFWEGGSFSEREKNQGAVEVESETRESQQAKKEKKLFSSFPSRLRCLFLEWFFRENRPFQSRGYSGEMTELLRVLAWKEKLLWVRGEGSMNPEA